MNRTNHEVIVMSREAIEYSTTPLDLHISATIAGAMEDYLNRGVLESVKGVSENPNDESET
jgi:hypothetical protein